MFNAEKVPDIEGYTHSFEPKRSSSCHLLHNKIFGKKKKLPMFSSLHWKTVLEQGNFWFSIVPKESQ